MKRAWNVIMVKDLKKSLTFYCDGLGFGIAREIVLDAEHKIVFLADEEGICIELIERNKGQLLGEKIAFIFQVDNLLATKQELTAKGLETGDVISPNPYVHFIHVIDPDGVVIQLQEKEQKHE